MVTEARTSRMGGPRVAQ